MDKFLLPPDQANYAVTDGVETLRTQLQGGTGRFRADILKSSYTARCSWTLTVAQWSYLRGFYKTRSENGAIPFLIDIAVNGGQELKEYIAYFIPRSMATSQYMGLTRKVDAQLEIIPNESDDDELLSNTLLYEIAGEEMFTYDLEGLFVDLNQLVNVEFPSLEVFNA